MCKIINCVCGIIDVSLFIIAVPFVVLLFAVDKLTGGEE